MTMPHLMNCDHSADSWCLDCVKEMYEDMRDRVEVLETAIEYEIGVLEASTTMMEHYPGCEHLHDACATVRRLKEALQ